MNLFFKNAYGDYDIEDVFATVLNGMILPWLWFGNNTRLLLRLGSPDWLVQTLHRPLTRQSSYSTVHQLVNI
jgi:hypothetical protein